MMFLQYAAPGVILPILSHYLKNHLLFTPFQVGLIMAMPAIAAIVAPFFVVFAADRLIRAERMLGLCHLSSGIVMLWLAQQNQFLPFLLVYFLYGLLFAPTFALTNAVAFHHLADAKRDFGSVRLWGPISWVVVAWGFSMLWLRGEAAAAAGSRLPHALLFSGFSSLVLGLYAFTLPVTSTNTEKRPSPLQSIVVFLRPNLLLLYIATLFNSMVHQFYYYGMSPFLSQIGLRNEHILPAMSMGQLGEVFALAFLGGCLARLGIKRTLIIGVLAQAARCLVFAFAGRATILAVIPSHGICYAFFFTVAFIYVDLHSDAETRAGAQQLFNILIAGFGTLLGNLAAGKLGALFTQPGLNQIDFTKFWLVSTALALGIALLLAVGFPEERKTTETS